MDVTCLGHDASIDIREFVQEKIKRFSKSIETCFETLGLEEAPVNNPEIRKTRSYKPQSNLDELERMAIDALQDL